MIRKTDSVASVLKRDEALINVFTELSPEFERLRNPAMRKVMARLVTVEQAARIAGVDGDELLRRLNRAGSELEAPAAEPKAEALAPEPAPPRGVSDVMQGVPAEKIVGVDVREDLRNGREPFSRIMAARQQLPDGGILVVRAIFEPVPLYAVMAKQGFAHATERLAADDWRVAFYPAQAGSVVQGPQSAAPDERRLDPGVVVLDVRGLEPPEPMVRTLAALEQLPPGGTLVQLNVRVPQFLLPQLEARGYSYEVREQAPDLVRVFIRRASDARSAKPSS